MSIDTRQPAPLKVSIRRAAVILDTSPSYTYRLIETGALKAVIDGDKRYILTSELQRYVESLTPVEPTRPRSPPAKPNGRPRKVTMA
ncbi:MAG TPA: helix-turn-helix domain-containing protein [Steroidobacteraceae bacterium]|nr:helix-turn-helix domain-containing protein [Steroidobacteraceae bacterium]